MKKIECFILSLIFFTVMKVCVFGQTVDKTVAKPSITAATFDTTTISFALTPVVLPGIGQSLAGAETDVMYAVTTNNSFGITTLISNDTFVGGRYERTFPTIAAWLQNHTNLTGAQFRAGVTGSLGVVKASTNYWGEGAGIFVKWMPQGQTTFSMGFDVEAVNLPGISHWTPKIAISPSFSF